MTVKTKQFKRSLSFLMTLVMLLGMFPTAAFAAKAETPETSKGIFDVPVTNLESNAPIQAVKEQFKTAFGPTVQVESDGKGNLIATITPVPMKIGYMGQTHNANVEDIQGSEKIGSVEVSCTIRGTTLFNPNKEWKHKVPETHIIKLPAKDSNGRYPMMVKIDWMTQNMGKGFMDMWMTLDMSGAVRNNAAEAAPVIALIKQLGKITLASEAKIAEARAAYDALVPASQAKVTNLGTLKDAEAELQKLKDAAAADQAAADSVDAKIAALGEITLDSEAAITEARKAYDGLTKTQKSMVKNLATLKAAEARLQELKDAAAADQAAAEAVDAKIAALGEITLESEAAITEARDAYTGLTEAQKALVKNLAALEAAEAKLQELKDAAAADQAAAEAVDAKIAALGDITLESETAITEARKAYDGLTKAQKALVKNLPTLEAAEAALAALKQGEADKAAAAVVEGKIAALGEITLESEAAITEARDAYTGLTEAQKALVKNLPTLEAAEAKLQELKEVAAANKAAAEAVDAKIAALGEITLESETAITEARKAYDGLTEAQKALVKNLATLEAAEVKLQELKEAAAADQAAAKAVEEQIAALGEITLKSEAAIAEARKAYDGLTEAQKALVKNLVTLEAAEAKIVELKNTVKLAEGNYKVPIISLTSGAPIPAVATEFSKSFGTEVLLNVDASGKMTATLTLQHLAPVVNGGTYHCNILKVKSAAGEATYPEMTNRQVTPTFGKPDAVQNIDCPAKAVVVLPAYESAKPAAKAAGASMGAYPLQVTADFMNALHGDINADHWMDVRLNLDLTQAKSTGPSYEYGSQKTVIKPGIYSIPTALMHADRHEQPSMAAAAILGGKLTVEADGAAFVNVKLGPVDAHGKHGWSTNWKIYDVYQCESQLPDDPKTLPLTEAEIVATAEEDGQTYPSEIRFKLPFTDKDGVYATMFVPVMGAYPNAFLSLDFTKLDNYDEYLANAVTDMIMALYQDENGMMDGQITLEDEPGILAARKAYDALTESQKALVGDNYQGLVQAEQALAELKAAAEADKAAAKAVEDQIAALGEITLESETAITEARNAYTGLTEAQKALVKNLPTLEAAEAALAALKQGEADKAAAAVVEGKIAALGEITLESETAITEARNAYTGLTEAQKALVKNLPTLEAAEAKLQELKDAAAQAEADKAAAEAVDAKIAALGEITLESEAAITEARNAYTGLTEAQKALVKNLPTLEAAEAKLQELKDAAAQAEADKAAAKVVEDQIAALGEITLESEAAITEARKAYDGLTEAQKALVKNLATLEAAEAKIAELKNTAVLSEGSYNVPIISLTSKAPLEPVAIAFSKAFGDTVRINVAADGSMTAVILPRHMNIDLFGSIYQCNVLKLRSTKGEAQYADITTQQYTDANDSQLHDIQAPGKMTVGMPAYDAVKMGYPLELTVDFMNTMYGNVAADNWMDVVLSLDFTKAEKIKTSEIAITQNIPAEVEVNKPAQVEFTLINSGDADFVGAAYIRFQGTNEDEVMTLTFPEGVKAEKHIVDGRFLGYNVNVTVPAGKSVTITAEAMATVAREFKFKTLTDAATSSTATLVVKEAPQPEVPGEIIDTGRTLSLDGEIHINQYVKISGFEGIDIAKNGGLLVWNNGPITEENAIFANADAIKQGLIAGNGEYGQQTDGIPAKEYANTIYLRVYIQLPDGSYVYGPLKEYSVRLYCETVISRNRPLKDTCIALLHYGAAAQINFNYNTGDLANKNIAADHPSKAWNPEYLTPLKSVNSSIIATGDVQDTGKTLSLDGAVAINFYFKTTVKDIKTAELLVWENNNAPLSVDNVSYTIDLRHSNSEYAAQSHEFAPRHYGNTIFTCAKFVDSNGNVHYSEVTAFSPEEYASRVINKSKNNNLVDTVKKMVMFGEEAQLYFNK